jgi:hypothetical protein
MYNVGSRTPVALLNATLQQMLICSYHAFVHPHLAAIPIKERAILFAKTMLEVVSPFAAANNGQHTEVLEW